MILLEFANFVLSKFYKRRRNTMPRDKIILYPEEGNPRKGAPFLFEDKRKIKSRTDLFCSMCKQPSNILTEIDFSKMVWIQRDNLQFIAENEFLSDFKQELCYHCREKLFASSVPCIRFNISLFEAMKQRGLANGN